MEATVTFLLETLKEEVVSATKQLSRLRDEIRSFCSDLLFIKGVIQSLTQEPLKDENLKGLMKRFIDAVYEAEDIVDEFFAEKANYKSMNLLKKFTHSYDHPKRLLGVAERIVEIKAEMTRIRDDMKFNKEAMPHREGSKEGTMSKKVSTVEEDHVDFEDRAKPFINLLRGGSDKLEVISIVGMPGLGKTTLAKMIFHDSQIIEEFGDHRIWIYVSRECNIKEAFLAILSHFTEVSEKERGMPDEKLVQELQRFLKKVKYLIVLDDVWTKNNWEELKTAFPDNNKKSKILITSRHKDVAKYANRDVEPLEVKLLNPKDSWKLLKRKAIGSRECPAELIKYGENIASQCQGLPLAIVVIGGILLDKGIHESWWKDVSGNVEGYINKDKDDMMHEIIERSYYNLPFYLKSCFLYFGMFPENHRIPVQKLIRLWIAEGFVKQDDQKMSLETSGESYLDDLVNMNLVVAEEWGPNGKIKTCYVHNMVHLFCKKKAAEENVYHEVIIHQGQSRHTSDNEMFRRICIHSQVLDYISSEALGSRVRSFLCFSPEEISLPSMDKFSIPKRSKLLRVLDGEPMILPEFPGNLSQLFHLKYLVLSIKDNILPAFIFDLQNLETLIVHTSPPSSRTLEVKGDTWKKIHLKHLQTNASTFWPALCKTSRKSKKDVLRCENLRMLSTISPETCTEDAFDRVPNLNKLGIRGELFKLLNPKAKDAASFENLIRLKSLEKLKLINEVISQYSSSQIAALPDRFPPTLKKVTLTNTKLDWKQISTLEKLEHLEILKLEKNAFTGDEWELKDGGFPGLIVLHIEETNLCRWEASTGALPELRSLYLKDCTYLKEVPFSLASIARLQKMDLYETTVSAVRSARKIEKERKQGTNVFQLNIFPHYMAMIR